MIITNDFVMLNFPKTGSSFARTVIKQAYANRLSNTRRLFVKLRICKPSVIELMMPKRDELLNYNIKDQHGTLRQIPKIYRDKPIFSITRNPISRYISTYLFRWWAEYPPVDIHLIRKKYPHFPDLSFSEYYEMIHIYGKKNRLSKINPKLDIGLHTIQFIQFYFDYPESVLKQIDDEYINEEQFHADMGPIKFLHQESLNADLREFLLNIGFNSDQIAFIDSIGKINVTDNSKKDINITEFYLENSIQKTIIERDKLLFRLFPEYLPKQ